MGWAAAQRHLASGTAAWPQGKLQAVPGHLRPSPKPVPLRYEVRSELRHELLNLQRRGPFVTRKVGPCGEAHVGATSRRRRKVHLLGTSVADKKPSDYRTALVL